MAFAKTLAELKEKGYRFENDAECKGCGESIEWWTSPNGKKIPMNPMERSEDEAIAHWTSCVEADSFRGKK